MHPKAPKVVAVLFLLAFLTIVDRVCISAAKNDMAEELGISDISFGIVFGAFAVGYAIAMAPGGWAGDRLGPRRFLTWIVCLWSLLTALTGVVRTLPLLVGVRLLFGGAEAGAFPTAARAIHNWLPPRRRGLALGIVNAGSRLGAAAGLVLTTSSIARFGWRGSFILLGAAGLLWAIGWYVWFRDNPPAEAPPPQDVRRLLSVNSALVVVQYFCSNFTFFICFSWLLPFLRSHFSLSAAQAGIYASVPLYFGALATSTSGMTIDWLYRRGHWSLSRRLPAIAGYVMASATLVAAAYASSPAVFTALFAITTFGVDFSLSSSWTTCSDIAGSRTGTLSGVMNAMGSLGSFSSSVCFPWLLEITGDVKTFFFAAAVLNLVGALCWWRLRVERKTA
jgi:ACS family glucarate transporter-like MFS transporter